MADQSSIKDAIITLFKCPIPWAPEYLPEFVRENIKNTQNFLGISDPIWPQSDQSLLQQINTYRSQCIYSIPAEQYDVLYDGQDHGFYNHVPFFTLAMYLMLTAITPSFYMVTNQWLNCLVHQTTAHKSVVSKCFIIFKGAFLSTFPIFFAILYFWNISIGISAIISTILSMALLFCGLSGDFSRQMILIGFPVLVAFSSSAPIYIVIIMEISLMFCFGYKNVSQAMPYHSLERLRTARFLSSNKRDHLLIICEYKALQVIITSIVILAVDFSTFPVIFCKTVYSGLSIMDLGVGGIIFMSGLVSKYAKGLKTDQNPLHFRLIRAIRSCGPLGVLGILRFFMLQILSLKTPVQEYGVHWNFYMTLMLVFICAELVCSTLHHPYLIGMFGFVLALFYQVMINMFNLAPWMFTGDRSGFFNANREGILGTIGFSSLYLIAVGIGKLLRDVVPRSTDPDNDVSAPKNKLTPQAFFCLIFVLAFAFLGIAFTLERILLIPASRRFVNITWISFMCALELFALGASAIVDSSLRHRQEIHMITGSNENQLLIFLLANVLTGCANLTMQTSLQPPIHVMIIMLFYTGIICYIGYKLGVTGRRIKLT